VSLVVLLGWGAKATAQMFEAAPLPPAVAAAIGIPAAPAAKPKPKRGTETRGRSQQLTSPDQVPDGLAKSDWASIRAAYEAGRHAFQPVTGQDGVWQACNPGQQWTTRFDGRGFVTEPRGGSWQWGLELTRYGFPGSERALADSASVTPAGQRLTYGWDDALQEWFVNDTRGLEHGFTVQTRPAGAAADAPLRFEFDVRGSLAAKVADDGLGVQFLDADGTTVLNYDGLKVWDADGKILTSRFTATPLPTEHQTPNTEHSASFTLLVDERNARYPLTIDPIAQQAYLKASNCNTLDADDAFGSSVAIDGDTVVIGAPSEDGSGAGVDSPSNDLAADAGAAYVFVRSGTIWTQQAYLKPSNTGAGDLFGRAVSISGDTVVVGANSEDGSGTGVDPLSDELAPNSGAVYVFVRIGTTWSQQAYLKASNTGTGDYFGHSVSIQSNTVVVGAYLEDGSNVGVDPLSDELALSAGAAYVFTRNGTTWSHQAYLKASNPGGGDFFGYSVSIDNSTVVVGAYLEDGSSIGVNPSDNDLADGAGAAYVFVCSGTTWSQQAYLKASNTDAGDGFGISVSVSSNTVVVGANSEDGSGTGVNAANNNSASSAGAAYVFVRSGTVWSQQAYLKASNTGSTDYFGRSVSVNGNTIAVGAYSESGSGTGVNPGSNELAADAGAAYVFVRSGTVWSQQAYLKAHNTGASDFFGFAVAVSDNTVVVGASAEDGGGTGVNPASSGSAIDAGAAYVFVRSGATWSHQAYVKASNTTAGGGSGTSFGYAVAVDGDTVVVGAYAEDGSGTGVNPASNHGAVNAGAAYVFVRDGTTWSQQAYLKAHNTDAGDYFGFSVDVDGNTVVVGAYSEDGSGTGVNPASNNSAANSGAVYVFVRNGVTWSQQAYLKASNTGTGDFFGYAVAIQSNTVVVGAYQEDGSGTGVNPLNNNSASVAGAAYVFVRNGTTWSQQAYLKASNTESADYFGFSVSVDDNTVVVGAFQEDGSGTGVNPLNNNSASGAGAAYVFVRSGTTWSHQAYLKASNTGEGDYFGCSVAVQGDSVIVGAYGEDGGGAGANPPSDESATDAGAAYVFVRNGATWSQQAYLKASNTGSTDYFGRAVALDGDTAVVGAQYEDGSGVGVGAASNDDALSSGAAYQFTRTGTSWNAPQYMKAFNTGSSDLFGAAVAVDGETIMVGAYGEDGNGTGVNPVSNDAVVNSGAVYLFGPSPEIGVQQPAGTDLTDGVSSIGFGIISVGASSAATTFTITNRGSATLSGLAVTTNGANAAEFAVGALGAASLAPGASTTFTVQFNPTSAGARAAAIHIASNDGDENPFTIELTGTGAVPVLQAPVMVSIGYVPQGTPAEQTFLITNTGDATLNIWNDAMFHPFGTDGILMGDLSSHSVPPGGTVTGTIVYAGTEEWGFSGSYEFQTDDPIHPFFMILVPVYTYPNRDVALLGSNAAPIPQGDTTPDLPRGTDFGSAPVTGGTVTRTFVVTNSGTATLTISDVTVTGAHAADFTVVSFPATVAPSASGNLVVTSDPSAAGLRTATITIVNDDYDEGTYDFAVQGTGISSGPKPTLFRFK
jgi:hypothetical protein